ncbi:MAG: poly(R)-hydroxyalkanoic acid synthase subunit PhaE [Halorientalis sp.]
MSDTTTDPLADWNELVEQLNDAVADSVEENMKAQSAFMESWAEAIDDSVPEEEELAEGFEGFNRAYEVWTDAAERTLERTTEAARGEDVEVTELRDIWLQSANEAFKEVMSTSAFAAANGQLVEAMMDVQSEVDDLSQETVQQLGVASRDDVLEVGERLVELERRQQAVEDKLDRILDEL